MKEGNGGRHEDKFPMLWVRVYVKLSVIQCELVRLGALLRICAGSRSVF